MWNESIAGPEILPKISSGQYYCSDLILLETFQPNSVQFSNENGLPVDWSLKEYRPQTQINGLALTHWPLGDLNEILEVIFKLILVIDGYQ